MEKKQLSTMYGKMDLNTDKKFQFMAGQRGGGKLFED